MQKIGQTLPLSLVRAGETVTVCRVRGNEDMKRQPAGDRLRRWSRGACRLIIGVEHHRSR